MKLDHAKRAAVAQVFSWAGLTLNSMIYFLDKVEMELFTEKEQQYVQALKERLREDERKCHRFGWRLRETNPQNVGSPGIRRRRGK